MKLRKVLLIVLLIAVAITGCNPNTPIEQPNPPFDSDNGLFDYDVIVIGGEPEGIAAAISSARNGLKVLLIEKRDGLGGLMTYGMLNFIDMNYDHQGKQIIHGIFREFYNKVGGDIFDINHAKEVFLDMVNKEKNITLMLGTKLESIVVSEDGNLIEQILVKHMDKTQRFKGRIYIDATQDADVAAMAGVPYSVGKEDIGLHETMMAATLMIYLENVDWNKVRQTARAKTFGIAEVNRTNAWGFEGFYKQYIPHDKTTRMRGLNIARQKDGSILINALQIFFVDGLDESSIADGMKRGKAETYHVYNFLKENFPGFEKARIREFPTELYIRETRHIYGEYRLSIVDVLESRDFEDGIGFGSYPVDIQSTSPENTGYIICNPKMYSIPLRSLIPLKIDNMMVVSRSASYDSLAAGSARVIPIGMVAGQGAGVAAKYAITEGVLLREIPYNKEMIEGVRSTLKSQGANVHPFSIHNEFMDHWSYPYMKELFSLGLIVGGYENDFKYDSIMDERGFVNLLNNALSRKYPDRHHQQLRSNLYIESNPKEPLSSDRAANFLLKAVGIKPIKNSNLMIGLEKGIVPYEFMNHLGYREHLTRADSYLLVSHILREYYKY